MSIAGQKNARSPIWNYFESVDTKNTRCLNCQGLYRNSGNTTNLFDHLKRRHQKDYQAVQEAMKQLQDNSNSSKNNNNSVISFETSEIPIAVENIKFESDTVLVETSDMNMSDEQDESMMENQQDGEDQELNDQEIVAELQDDDHNVQVVKIVPLPHARSEVWTYFGFVADNDGQIIDRSKVVCKICATTLCYSGNTTNFYSHLKSMHSEVQMRAVPNKNAKIMKRTYSNMAGLNSSGGAGGDDSMINADDDNEYNDNGTNADHSSINNNHNKSLLSMDGDDRLTTTRSREDIIYVEDITQAIVDFLVTDCRPVCVVQGKGFQRLLRLLAPDYVFPDRQRLSIAVRKRFDEARNEMVANSTNDRNLIN